jgi:hypothetical protein
MVAQNDATAPVRNGLPMNDAWRRVAAGAVALTLGALVGCDLWIRSVRTWGDDHSLTGSVVTNLLVLAVTALIVDEVVARRQRRQRALSVAVQGLIVYSQARRAYDAVMAEGDGESGSSASEELRSFASMLLTASPSLFDDPVARSFLEQVQRLSGSMFRTVSASSRDPLNTSARELLAADMSGVHTAMQPLLARVPTADQSLFEAPRGPADGPGSDG